MKHKTNPKILPETTDPLATSKRDSREEAFINALMVTDSIPDAGIMAGYSESYATVGLYAKFKDARFQSKLIEHFKAHCFSDLPTILKINKLGLNRIQRDLESGNGDLAAKLKHIPRQTMEITRLLNPEGTGATINLVNIESMQAIITGKLQSISSGSDKTNE
jgi:hypothetical protein